MFGLKLAKSELDRGNKFFMVISTMHFEGLTEILGGEAEVDNLIQTEWDLIHLSKRGLKKSVLRAIAFQLGISVPDTVHLLGMPLSEFLAMQESDTFNPRYSEHLLKLAELVNESKILWETDRENFKGWLQAEIPALGGKRPVELLDTVYGIEMVITILVRIVHGVYS